MRKGLRQAMIVLGICMCLGGCEKETEAKTEPEGETVQSEDGDFFPESYSEETEKVKFECVVNVPEKFEVTNFHAPIIKGVSNIDAETAYKKYVEGKVVTEEYHDEPTIENEKGNDTYILEDGTVIGLSGVFLYNTSESSIYRQVVRMSERSAPKDNFKFASGDDCTEQVKEELRSLGCPVDEYQFDWFSTSGEDYAILEKRALDDGMIDSQRAKQDGWTEANNSYEIYGWQLYEGLQVLPPWITSAMSRAFESYQKAPISAVYTKQGMLSLALTEAPCIFEHSDETLEFLKFPEIADILEEKYSALLDDAVYTVTYAKLVLRTYFDEGQKLAAEPVWYFEVTDGTSMEVALLNAVTGTEIFLN